MMDSFRQVRAQVRAKISKSKSEEGKATKSTSRVPMVTAQLYDRIQTQSTLGFAADLPKYGVRVIKRATVEEIARDAPVLVMCQNYSRIAADILHATEGLKGIRGDMVVVIIIHAKAKHSLPSMMTAEYIEDPTCKNFGLLVDFGFVDGMLYDCDMNKQGQTKLTSFLQRHSVLCGSSQQLESKHRKLHDPTSDLSKRGQTLQRQSTKQDDHLTGACAGAKAISISHTNYTDPFQRTVQLYDSTDTTTSNDFSKMLESKLRSDYSIRLTRSRPPDISPDKPVLVVCQNYSELEADIKWATERLTDIPVEKVAVLIIHAKKENSLPKCMSSEHLGEDACQKFGLLIDFGYLDKALYECDMNKLGENKLKVFLSKYIDLQARSGDRTSGEEQKKRQTRTLSGGSGYCPIQLYAENFIELKTIPNIPGHFQVVRSVADLRKENLWVVVCDGHSFEEQQIRKAESANGKILVTIDPDASKNSSGKQLTISLYHLNIGRSDGGIDLVKTAVMQFISVFVENDAKAIFENNQDESARIEVFQAVKEGTEKEIDPFLESLSCRHASSVTDFTKHDPRILWLIICEPHWVNMFEQASSTNAKVMIVFNDDISTADFDREERQNLLILRLRPNSLSVIADKLKEEIIQFMKTVEQRLWLSPLEELFNSDVPKKIFYQKEKGGKCSIL